MKNQKIIIERLNEIKRLTALAQHDNVSKAQIKVFKARIETLNWVLEE
jgi:hypothetical protein